MCLSPGEKETSLFHHHCSCSDFPKKTFISKDTFFFKAMLTVLYCTVKPGREILNNVMFELRTLRIF